VGSLTPVLVVLFCLAVQGLTLAVSTGKIFEPARALAHKAHPRVGELLKCPMCSGFWFAVALALAMGVRGLDVFTLGLAGSAWTYMAHVWLVSNGSERL
jgi:hypothetical protein